MLLVVLLFFLRQSLRNRRRNARIPEKKFFFFFLLLLLAGEMIFSQFFARKIKIFFSFYNSNDYLTHIYELNLLFKDRSIAQEATGLVISIFFYFFCAGKSVNYLFFYFCFLFFWKKKASLFIY